MEPKTPQELIGDCLNDIRRNQMRMFAKHYTKEQIIEQAVWVLTIPDFYVVELFAMAVPNPLNIRVVGQYVNDGRPLDTRSDLEHDTANRVYAVGYKHHRAWGKHLKTRFPYITQPRVQMDALIDLIKNI